MQKSLKNSSYPCGVFGQSVKLLWLPAVNTTEIIRDNYGSSETLKYGWYLDKLDPLFNLVIYFQETFN